MRSHLPHVVAIASKSVLPRVCAEPYAHTLRDNSAQRIDESRHATSMEHLVHNLICASQARSLWLLAGEGGVQLRCACPCGDASSKQLARKDCTRPQAFRSHPRRMQASCELLGRNVTHSYFERDLQGHVGTSPPQCRVHAEVAGEWAKQTGGGALRHAP